MRLDAFLRMVSCTQGDICYIIGAKTGLVNDSLYFIGGNYSVVSLDGQTISPSTTLYSLDVNNQFPVERSIPQSLLTDTTIASQITAAYNSSLIGSNGDAAGALWHTNDTIYIFGGGFETPTNSVSSYNVRTSEWKEVEVKGGSFNFGNRSSAQYVSVPERNLGFVGMIRFDASDPNNLSWTNETLGNGSYGADVPNLDSGTMVYVPAGKEGMLISFGGSNVAEGINPAWGWPYDSDWYTIYVYDIASHTWWQQLASGNAPSHTGSFCAAVTTSPDNDAFHITTYGGWSLNNGRSYEDVHILSLPSFTWINATLLSNKSNKEEQVNSTIGRDSITGGCQTYRGAQMIVLGGDIRAGAYRLTNGACNDVFSPVRVLDLSTYVWQTELNNSASYEVPAVIYNAIGGGATGGATSTAPAAGFADPTLASLIQLRVTSATSTSIPTSSVPTPTPTPTLNPSGVASESHSSSVNAGAIVGGVVGGVIGLGLVAAFVWFLFKRNHSQEESPEIEQKNAAKVFPSIPQEMETRLPQKPEADSGPIFEMPETTK
ncbi:hypothetical protein BGW36DRAFT_402059 [Talaromyces proteolyticus]|uniref:Kelch repeat protein n=1 Tax=Talaromyces proteolyticus TaxID=1131652 RepID=A0AAD4KDI5_9EURO|nr:uncharacterized protein BGW36DRAFT_402059 [Talaromyces proteolyticus]KAH8689001.1 hypothetical protein BGW36DRAFT_402059 [Talaromyces proteolyticus]